jgi:probable rRNA maturation factor
MQSNSSEEPAWYNNRQRRVRIDDAKIRAFVRRAGREVARGREFAVLIASDAFVRQANRRFRGKSASTDVLSFPDGAAGRLGDILVSAARAARQAHEQNHTVEDELKVLILHGLLHLLGYDHEADLERMKRAESRWRKKFGLALTLVERAQS